MSSKPSLEAAYGLQGPDDNRRLYADWAATYDSDFAEAKGYRLPIRVAEAFVAAGGAGPVLDLGAGTGLCGAALRMLGVEPIEATDLSEAMLAVAASKGLYMRLFPGDMTAGLPVPDGAYRGVTCSGTFTHGHVGPEALEEVLRVLAPGGLAALSVNAAHWEARGFAAEFTRHGARIEDLACAETAIYAPGAEGAHAGDTAFVVTFRRKS